MSQDAGRRKALDMAVAAIEKNYGKGSIMRLGSDAPVEIVPIIHTGAISLDAALGIDDLADLADLLLGQVLDPDVGVDSGLSQDRVGAVTPDPVDVGEADLDTLLPRQIHSGNTCHGFS